MSTAEKQEEMAARGVKYIFAQFTDIHGAAKGKLIPLAHLDDIVYPGKPSYDTKSLLRRRSFLDKLTTSLDQCRPGIRRVEEHRMD